MAKLVKRYALIATDYWDSMEGEYKDFALLEKDLDEADLEIIFDRHNRYEELYNESVAAGEFGIIDDSKLYDPSDTYKYSLKYCNWLWKTKSLIIENYIMTELSF